MASVEDQRLRRGILMTEATAAINLVAHTDPRRGTHTQMVLIEAGLDPEILTKRPRDDGDAVSCSTTHRGMLASAMAAFDKDPQYDWGSAGGRWLRRVRSGLASMPSDAFEAAFSPDAAAAAAAATATSSTSSASKASATAIEGLTQRKKGSTATAAIESFSGHKLKASALGASAAPPSSSTALTLVNGPTSGGAAGTVANIHGASSGKQQMKHLPMPEAAVYRRRIGLAERLAKDKKLSESEKIARLADVMGKARANFSRQRRGGGSAVGAAAAAGAVTGDNQAFVAGLEKGGAMKTIK